MGDLDIFFNNLYVIEQEFNVKPIGNNHKGIAIKYLDIQERREEFINELVNNVILWTYGKEKCAKIKQELLDEGRSESNAYLEIRRKAFNKFRKSKVKDEYMINGQFGELILFLVIKYFFEANPILRKMPITTSQGSERYGADAIHIKEESNKHILYLGEAKTYETKYKFNDAFEKAIDSILDTYNNYRNELDFYMYEDFIEEKYEDIAKKIKNGTIDDLEVHLINVVIYNENKRIDIDPIKGERYIKEQIENIIKERFEGFDYSKIKFDENKIMYRINYIIFPIWNLDNLLDSFIKEL